MVYTGTQERTIYRKWAVSIRANGGSVSIQVQVGEDWNEVLNVTENDVITLVGVAKV
jgi:hypothetical protein